jgi:tetratricopeptide (TPR) repeat protein
MGLQSNNDQTWLVKSAGSILGPFSHDEVEAELRSKRIVVIDEIKSSQGRWKFIRECEDFHDLIVTLRDEQLTGHDDSNLTQTGFTQSVTDIQISDETTPISPALLNNGKKGKSTPSKFGYSADQKLQVSLNSERKRTATLAWVLLVIVIGIGVYGYTTMTVKKQRGNGYKDALRKARIEKSLGNYEESLDLFRKVYAVKMPSAAGELESLPLMLMAENADVQVQRSLERIITSGALDETSKLEADSLLALTYLRQSQYGEAERRYKKILEKFPNNEVAQINLNEISVILGRNFSKVYDDITKMLKDGSHEKTLVLHRALVTLLNAESSKNGDNIERSIQDVERYLAKYQDYRPEALLIAAGLNKKARNFQASERNLKDLIVTDPDLTSKHRHNYLINQGLLKWKFLSKICINLLDVSTKTMTHAGLAALCAYQNGDLKTALDLAEKARNQYSNESLLIGLYGFMLLKSSRDEEANAILQIPGARDFELGLSLHADSCVKSGDWGCAETDWKALQGMNPQSLEASVGLATAAFENGRQDSAQDWIKRGLMTSEDFRPLLTLERQINEP